MSKIATSILLLTLAPVLGCKSSEPDEQAAPAVQLEHTDWNLVSLQGKPLQPGQGEPLRIRFDGPGEGVSGYGGLNQFHGTYQLSGASLRFGPLTMTRKGGPAPLMQQESALAQALVRTASWRASGGGVDLLDAGGAPLVHLAR